MQPRLFTETEEAPSQAEMLSQILRWADPAPHYHHTFLHGLGVEFLEMILVRRGMRIGLSPRKVEVGVQREGIGVWAVVDERIPILVEDKLGPISHGGHLERSLAKAIGWGYPVEPVGVYVQTVEEIPYEVLHSGGYEIITRRALLGLLRFGTGQLAKEECAGLQAFAEYLEALEVEARSSASRA